jgi:MFS transporter, DHA2 family, multidrug resistance protein
MAAKPARPAPEKLDPALIRTAAILIAGALASIFDTTIISVARHTLSVKLHTPGHDGPVGEHRLPAGVRHMTQKVERPEKGVLAGGSGRWWALAALALSGLTIGLDATVLNIALPELSTSLHATTGQLQWFATAYTLVVGVAMLPAANLGDRYGRKRLLVGSLVLFAAASAWCALSTSAGELIAARGVLGLAGAAQIPLGFAMLPTLFPERDARARAVALWTLASSAGLPLGPIIGGWLLDHFWWGSVFLINVPLAAVGAAALTVFLPEARSARPLALDWPGLVLSAAGLAGVIYGFINADQHGWGATATWAPILAGLVLLAGFIAWQRRSSHPLIELSLFTNRNFAWGTVHGTIANFALFGLLFAVPQYFQSVDGATPLGTGLRLLPMIAGMLAGTSAGGRLARLLGARIVIAVGFLLAAAALGAAATTSVGTGYGFAAAWIVVLGVGIGLALPAALSAALGALTDERAGAGSGLLQATRQLGGTIGVAVLGTVLGSGYRARADAGHLPAPLADAVHSSVAAGIAVARQLHDDALAGIVRAAFVHGMDLTLVVSGALVLAGAVLAALFLPRQTRVRRQDLSGADPAPASDASSPGPA